MPKRRIVFEDRATVYHVMNRLVRREYWLDEGCREVLVGLIRRYADFTGVEVLTYCIMSNHFHLLIRVPPSALWSHRAGCPTVDDATLLARYRRFYGKRRPLGGPSAAELEALLAAGGSAATSARERILARMGNLSVFMRELKYAFAGWFNERFDNEGTIWSAKFKSIIVEDVTEVRARVAAYIDCNPLRAGMVSEAGDYRWSGYAGALAGDAGARRGILRLFSGATTTGRDAEEALAAYRNRWISVQEEAAVGTLAKTPDSANAPVRQVVLGEARAIGREGFIALVQKAGAGPGQKKVFRPRDVGKLLGGGLFALWRRRIRT